MKKNKLRCENRYLKTQKFYINMNEKLEFNSHKPLNNKKIDKSFLKEIKSCQFYINEMDNKVEIIKDKKKNRFE